MCIERYDLISLELDITARGIPIARMVDTAWWSDGCGLVNEPELVQVYRSLERPEWFSGNDNEWRAWLSLTVGAAIRAMRCATMTAVVHRKNRARCAVSISPDLVHEVSR